MITSVPFLKWKNVILVGAIASLIACTSRSERRNATFAYQERPVETIYNDAVEELERGRLAAAILFFDEVERQHPYSPWARRSILMSAFAQFEASKYEDAIAALDRFLAVHPGNKDADYAYYLKALCYYERIRDVGRDQDITRNALNALTDVVRRYPDSAYAVDARLKLDLTYDHLAGKEMSIGRYYLRRNQHTAAINRFNRVIVNYQTTTHVPEALHRMVEAYLEMGVIREARRHAAFLGYNYPGSTWYADAYKLFTLHDIPVQARLDDMDAPF